MYVAFMYMQTCIYYRHVHTYCSCIPGLTLKRPMTHLGQPCFGNIILHSVCAESSYAFNSQPLRPGFALIVNTPFIKELTHVANHREAQKIG